MTEMSKAAGSANMGGVVSSSSPTHQVWTSASVQPSQTAASVSVSPSSTGSTTSAVSKGVVTKTSLLPSTSDIGLSCAGVCTQRMGCAFVGSSTSSGGKEMMMPGSTMKAARANVKSMCAP